MYLCNGYGLLNGGKIELSLIFLTYFDHKDSTYEDLDYNPLLEDDGDYGNLYTNGINYDSTTEKTHIPGLDSNQ